MNVTTFWTSDRIVYHTTSNNKTALSDGTLYQNQTDWHRYHHRPPMKTIPSESQTDHLSLSQHVSLRSVTALFSQFFHGLRTDRLWRLWIHFFLPSDLHVQLIYALWFWNSAMLNCVILFYCMYRASCTVIIQILILVIIIYNKLILLILIYTLSICWPG